jgi:hypothetical protein
MLRNIRLPERLEWSDLCNIPLHYYCYFHCILPLIRLSYLKPAQIKRSGDNGQSLPSRPASCHQPTLF